MKKNIKADKLERIPITEELLPLDGKLIKVKLPFLIMPNGTNFHTGQLLTDADFKLIENHTLPVYIIEDESGFDYCQHNGFDFKNNKWEKSPIIK